MFTPRSLVLFVLPMAIVGCGGADEFEPKELPMSRVEAFWPPHWVSQNYVVQTEAQWQAVWAAHDPLTSPPTPRPRIDFDSVMVVGITRGSAPNGCYGLAIRKVIEEACEVRVEYKYSEPPKDVLVLCTQSIVALTDFVTVPHSDKPVYFARTDA